MRFSVNKLNEALSFGELDVILMELPFWQLLLAIVVVFGIYYYGDGKIGQLKSMYEIQYGRYQKLSSRIREKYSMIRRLSGYKSNTIFLMSKLQTLNNIDDILRKRNFSFTMYVGRPTSLQAGGMINVDRLAVASTKMGVYRYMPLRIVVRDYVDFPNLLETLKLLQDSNFILTGVKAVKTRTNTRVTLIGRLYVK